MEKIIIETNRLILRELNKNSKEDYNSLCEILKDKEELYGSIDKIINNIEKMDLIDTLKNADIIYKSQEDKQDILEYINIILFKKAKQNQKYLNCINIVEDTKKRLRANSNYNMTIDNMIMTIWEEIHWKT